jgi:hypothetical protein
MRHLKILTPHRARQYYGRRSMEITELLQRVHTGDAEALRTVIPPGRVNQAEGRW